jgi:hypothetical protein
MNLDAIPHDPYKTGAIRTDRYNLRNRLSPFGHNQSVWRKMLKQRQALLFKLCRVYGVHTNNVTT